MARRTSHQRRPRPLSPTRCGGATDGVSKFRPATPLPGFRAGARHYNHGPASWTIPAMGRNRAERPWPRSFSRSLGGRAARLGERLGIDWLTYNPLYFRDIHGRALSDAPAVMRAFATHFPDAERLIDVGAGGGALPAGRQRRGGDVGALGDQGPRPGGAPPPRGGRP